jgi:putative Holliday junction resolvase
MQFLKEYCQKEPVDIFVVGQPKHMDNTPSQSSKIIEPFVQQLAQTFPEKEIARIDERFTSKMAFQAMIDGGLKKKQRQDKGMVDQVSATIMLQDYMRTLQ